MRFEKVSEGLNSPPPRSCVQSPGSRLMQWGRDGAGGETLGLQQRRVQVSLWLLPRAGGPQSQGRRCPAQWARGHDDREPEACAAGAQREPCWLSADGRDPPPVSESELPRAVGVTSWEGWESSKFRAAESEVRARTDSCGSQKPRMRLDPDKFK